MKTAEWIEALRSGKYEQGQNALCNDGLFCCLGVLCEVAGLEKRDVEDVDPMYPDLHATEVSYVFPLFGDSGVEYGDSVIPHRLQSTILEDLDLTQFAPELPLYSEATLHDRLISMNDDGETFETIADYIEQVKNDAG